MNSFGQNQRVIETSKTVLLMNFKVILTKLCNPNLVKISIEENRIIIFLNPSVQVTISYGNDITVNEILKSLEEKLVIIQKCKINEVKVKSLEKQIENFTGKGCNIRENAVYINDVEEGFSYNKNQSIISFWNQFDNWLSHKAKNFHKGGLEVLQDIFAELDKHFKQNIEKNKKENLRKKTKELYDRQKEIEALATKDLTEEDKEQIWEKLKKTLKKDFVKDKSIISKSLDEILGFQDESKNDLSEHVFWENLEPNFKRRLINFFEDYYGDNNVPFEEVLKLRHSIVKWFK